MCVMLVLDYGDDRPWLKCSSCETVFQVVWNRTPVYDNIEYCPFCGDEIESFEEE